MPIGSSLSGLAPPIPPERGAFPLDLQGKCKDLVLKYIQCLKDHRTDKTLKCRHLSKEYLKCRMDHGLMMKDDLKNLGFKD